MDTTATTTRTTKVALPALLAALAASPGVAQESVVLRATDGGPVHASWYRAPTPRTGVIVAFHQGGADGRGEYGPLVPRLTGAGWDVLVVDQRAGGDRFGGTNRTVQARGEPGGYCEAYPDLEGALGTARDDAGGAPIVLWGSSYSAALVLRLAALDPAGVAGVLAFSPASGGPMAPCRGEELSDRIEVPVLALRPASEMERASSSEQFETFVEQGHEVFVAEPGTHGSSMLVEERVGAPVDETWARVSGFLERVGGGPAASPFLGQVKPVLYVRDVERSAPFFRDVLGFDLLGYTDREGEPYYAEMAAASLKFGLHDPLNEEHGSWVGHQRIYFRVDDVAAHRERVAAAGGSPGELIETAWMDMFIVRDPDGHQIVFAETDPARHTVDPW